MIIVLYTSLLVNQRKRGANHSMLITLVSIINFAIRRNQHSINGKRAYPSDVRQERPEDS